MVCAAVSGGASSAAACRQWSPDGPWGSCWGWRRKRSQAIWGPWRRADRVLQTPRISLWLFLFHDLFAFAGCTRPQLDKTHTTHWPGLVVTKFELKLICWYFYGWSGCPILWMPDTCQNFIKFVRIWADTQKNH